MFAKPLPLPTFPAESCNQGPEPVNKEVGTRRRGSARTEETERFFSLEQGASFGGTLPLGEQTLLRREQSTPLDQRNTGSSEQVNPDFRRGGFRGKGRQAAVDSSHSFGYSASAADFQERDGKRKKGFVVYTLVSIEGGSRLLLVQLSAQGTRREVACPVENNTQEVEGVAGTHSTKTDSDASGNHRPASAPPRLIPEVALSEAKQHSEIKTRLCTYKTAVMHECTRYFPACFPTSFSPRRTPTTS